MFVVVYTTYINYHCLINKCNKHLLCFITSVRENICFVCLFACLTINKITLKLWTNVREIYGTGRPLVKEKSHRFWESSAFWPIKTRFFLFKKMFIASVLY